MVQLRSLLKTLFFAALVILNNFCTAETAIEAPHDGKAVHAPLSPPANVSLDEELSPIGDEHESHFYRDFMSMLTTLGLMVAGLLFLSWLLRKGMHTRVQQMNEASEIKILETRTLSQRSSVYLIEVEGQKLVVGESSTGINLLTKL